MWHRTEKRVKIIKMAVSKDFGLNRAEKEKMMKYQDLKHDLKETFKGDRSVLSSSGPLAW